MKTLIIKIYPEDYNELDYQHLKEIFAERGYDLSRETLCGLYYAYIRSLDNWLGTQTDQQIFEEFMSRLIEEDSKERVI